MERWRRRLLQRLEQGRKGTNTVYEYVFKKQEEIKFLKSHKLEVGISSLCSVDFESSNPLLHRSSSVQTPAGGWGKGGGGGFYGFPGPWDGGKAAVGHRVTSGFSRFSSSDWVTIFVWQLFGN